MKKNYKYDVAISCAEEDLPIAEQIASAFRSRQLSYYLYTEHSASHWGENIFKISLDKYGAEAQYVLILISKYYIQKHWSDIERQIAQTIARIGETYILPLQLDAEIVAVDGLGKNIQFQRWADNAEEIANMISEKLKLKEANNTKETSSRTNIFKTRGDTIYIEKLQEFNSNNRSKKK